MNSNIKSWMITTTMTIDFGSTDNLDIFLKAYYPESESMLTKRSKISIKTNDTYVTFEVNGLDINAMRASLNSILNFTNVVKKTLDFVENGNNSLEK